LRHIAATRDNIWALTTIPGVREILALHATKLEAELLRRRADGTWPEVPEDIGRDGTLRLESIGLALNLADLYALTHLARGA
jgi:hypothetical protein